MASSVISWLLVPGGIRRAKKTHMREANNYIPVATLMYTIIHSFVRLW